MYQSEVLGQRLDTRDELGFERSWCCEDVDEDNPPQDGRVVGAADDDDFPLREGSSPGESLRWRAKVLLPKFHLEAVVLRPESPPLIFF